MALQNATKCPYTGEHAEQTHSTSVCNPGQPWNSSLPRWAAARRHQPRSQKQKSPAIPYSAHEQSCFLVSDKHSLSSSTSGFAFLELRTTKAGRSDKGKRVNAEALLCLYTSPLGCGLQVRGEELPVGARLRVSHPQHYSEPH